MVKILIEDWVKKMVETIVVERFKDNIYLGEQIRRHNLIIQGVLKINMYSNYFNISCFVYLKIDKRSRLLEP